MANDQKPQSNSSNLGQPIDPTTDPQSMMGDTSGMTGIRVTGDDQVGKVALSQSVDEETQQERAQDMISLSDDVVTEKVRSDLTDGDIFVRDSMMGDNANDTISEASAPHVIGEQSVSGDMPDPESDDDVLEMSHQVGLRLDEDEENPQELNIAADVAAAERSRRGTMDRDDDY